MRKTFSICCIIIISVIIANINLFAEGSKTSNPSLWAKDTVMLARGEEIVDDEINNAFTQDITREEFVSLTNRAYKKFVNKSINTSINAFKDIKDSKFEKDIIESYNSNLVDGISKDLFSPKKNITREQVAKLLVTLMKGIDPNKKYLLQKRYDFADKKLISNWALWCIEYCYENAIFKGVGENKINPKGNTTREQAIVLVYRIMEVSGLSKLPPIVGNEDNNKINIKDNSVEYEKNLGKENINLVNKISETIKNDRNLETFNLQPEIVNITFKIGDFQNSIRSGNYTSNYGKKEKRFIVSANAVIPDDKNFMDIFEKFINLTSQKIKIIQKFEEVIIQIKKTGKLEDYSENFDDGSSFSMFSSETSVGFSYSFEYKGPVIN